MTEATFVVGIDLGTTNTIVAASSLTGSFSPSIFPIPQLVANGEIEARPLFPSCLYAPIAGENVTNEWDDAPFVAGEFAKKRGAEVVGRGVASAKSWLSHRGVDPYADILPWGVRAHEGVDDAPRISPVDASARYLAHVRRAWNAAHPSSLLEDQEVVLTVPASFDEVARELTLAAATRAGLRVRLLEEPQAAFYDFLRSGPPGQLEKLARDRDALVLVCDVGGGTTDLSLFRVAHASAGKSAQAVERIAVGSHLLLGGDNMDLALAHLCESRLKTQLDAARFGQLVSACRGAKEKLLGARTKKDAEIKVTVLAGGSQLVGTSLSTTLTRADVTQTVLEGFLPDVARDARPDRTRSALVAFGLPYERDVAITRHIAWFLARHSPDGAMPDAILFNGGVFHAKAITQRILDAIASWGGRAPKVLANDDPDLAVARGAAAYGLALRGHGARIEGGAARGYYVGLDAADGEAPRRAICIVPRGAKEGAIHVAKARPLALVVGRPVRFDLFVSSDARIDQAGEVVTIDEEHFERLAPIAVTFDENDRARAREIRVALEGELTPIGTLDLACVEVTANEASESPRRFRLAFQLRNAARPPLPPSLPPPSLRSSARDQALAAIERAFGKPPAAPTPRDVKDLVRDLERGLGDRALWTTELARSLFDAIAPNARARRRSADHERVFWMLAGFCGRPGFGDPNDAARVRTIAPLFVEKLAFPESTRNWQQFWIAWRRLSGGLDEAAQTSIRDFVDPFLAPAERGLKKAKKVNPDAKDEMLEMASSFERVDPARKSELGSWILERTWTDRDPRLWAALGRLGARVPAYAGVHQVVAPPIAERWLDHLLREKWDQVVSAPRAAVQLARITGDRARDISDRVRKDVEKKLVAIGARDEWVRAVRELVVVEETERAEFFGESLPIGLKLLA